MLPAENLDNKIKEFWPKNGPPTQEIEKYVKKYLKEKIVIKCGGRLLLDQDLFNNFINDVAILKKLGLTPIIVHGGGPRIKKKLDKLNIQTKFIMGLRVTDEKVIKVVEDVMTKFNKEIVAALEKKICKAKSITIKENISIYVHQKNQELGFVGSPDKIDANIIKKLIKDGYIPVVTPMGLDEKNQAYNVNADVVKKENACIKINQDDLNTGIMEETIKKIFDNNSEIENLKLNAKIFSKPKATENIVSEAMELIS